MTVSYQFNVHTSGFFGFGKLLTKWRGSVYKLVYKEMLLYVTSFGLISFAYRHLLMESQKRTFEKISLHFARYLDLIPLSFVLGFYVTHVVQRWWSQFTTIPWPDRLMNTIILYVDGVDERGRMIRRTLMRYWNLSFVMILSSISIAVKKRFPTHDHLVEAGFMTGEELQLIKQIQNKINKYFVPMCWFLRLLDQAQKEGRVERGAPMKHILEELNATRTKMSLLWCHDWVTVPLVYTQVVTWATHLFFVGCLVGRQFLDPKQNIPGHDIDLYVPVFTLLQFFFYMGWLKVAEQLINPFGEDDDDFETNWLIDRHIQVSYLGVDELYNKNPRLVKDLFFDSKDTDVPYTSAALIHRIPTYSGSTMHLKIPDSGRRDAMIHADSAIFDLPRRLKSRSGRWKECLKSMSFCRKRPHIFDEQTMWQELNQVEEAMGSTPMNGKKKGLLSPRTLGRKESLMADDFLAMLNAGRRRSHRPNGGLPQQQHHLSQQHGHVSTYGDRDSWSHPHPMGNSISQLHLEVPDGGPDNRRHSRQSFTFGRQESFDSSGSGPTKEELLPHQARHPSLASHQSASTRYSSGSEFEEEDVLGGPHAFETVAGKTPLSRLSEVENETDGEYSLNNTPYTSPYTTINNPEVHAKLDLRMADDESEPEVDELKGEDAPLAAPEITTEKADDDPSRPFLAKPL